MNPIHYATSISGCDIDNPSITVTTITEPKDLSPIIKDALDKFEKGEVSEEALKILFETIALAFVPNTTPCNPET